MTVTGVHSKCNECGAVIESTNGEGLRQKEREHMKKCHNGFTSLGQTQVKDPRVLF